MMLRPKLLLAQVPLGLALGIVGVSSLYTVAHLGDQSQRVLNENYRSILAAQRMSDAVERLNDAALFRVLGEQDRAQEIEPKNLALFVRELYEEEHNTTEVGERQAAEQLHLRWSEFHARYKVFSSTDTDDLAKFYFEHLAPSFDTVKSAAAEILAINQDAMVRKSEDARRAARRMTQLMSAVSILALLFGFFASGGMTGRLLRPLNSLSQAARRIGVGDLEVRANVFGSDEIADLAKEFNTMAERLAQYRKSTLGDLLRAQQAAQAAIDSIPDPVVVFDVHGQAMTVNQAGESLLRIRTDAGREALSSSEPEVRAKLEAVRDHVLAGRGAFTPKGFEDAVRLIVPDGERYLLPRATPLYAQEGGISGATVILQDVTRLRRFDELKNDLVATVAHEFRTPLTSLRMAVHLVLEQAAGPVTGKQVDLLEAARADCERLQAIVDDLLDLARLQAGKLELHTRPAAPAEMIAAAIGPQESSIAQHELKLASHVIPSIDRVLADTDRFQIILTNLLSNAIRHTSPGGTITVGATPLEEEVRFEVEDTGEGIAPEYRERIFERFFRVPGAKSGAGGLGLSIAKEIVEAHGGRMGVESQPGAGSKFWFTIPYAPKLGASNGGGSAAG